MAQYAEDVDLKHMVRPDKRFRYPEHVPTIIGCRYKVVLDDFSELYLEWFGDKFDDLWEDKVAFFYSPEHLQKKAKDPL